MKRAVKRTLGGRDGHRLLITGGTGFLGSRLTRRALGRGWRVFVLTRRPDGATARQLALEGARLLLGDVTSRESVRAAVERARPRWLIHSAGCSEWAVPRQRRRQMRAVNVDGVETVLSLAAELGVERVVYLSSTLALGDTGEKVADERFERRVPPISWQEATRAEALVLARRHQSAGEPIVIVAPAQVIGPGDPSPFGKVARRFLRRRLTPIGWAPQSAFTFVHIDDVVEGTLAAAERGTSGELYFLAGDSLTLRETMDVWRRREGRTPVRLWLPRPLALGQAMLLSPLAGSTFLAPEAVRSCYASFRCTGAKAQRELGVTFRPADQAWEETLKAEAELIRAGSPEEEP